MTPDRSTVSEPRTVGASPRRQRHHYASRLDRPDLRRGNMVWWKAGLYEVESVEQHGERWIAVLVKPGDVGKLEVCCWFAGVSELQAEPGR